MFEHWLTLQFPGLRGWNKKHSSLRFPPSRRGAVATIWWWYGWNSQLLNKFKRNANKTISTSSNSSNITKINLSEKSSPSNLQNLNLQPTKIRSEAFSNRHIRPWKWMVGRWFISSWEWPIFRGDMLVSRRVSSQMSGCRLIDLHPAIGATSGHQVTRGRKPGRWWEVATILVSLVGMKKTYYHCKSAGSFV